MLTEKRVKILLFVIFIVLSMKLIQTYGTNFTSFIIKEKAYSEEINLLATTSGNFTWEPDKYGSLKSLKFDGSISDPGKVRIFIENNGRRYLLYESREEVEEKRSEGSQITAFTVKEDIKPQSFNPITIDLGYFSNSFHDENNDGEENIYGVVDLSIQDTFFDWKPKEKNLCTRWEIYNRDDYLSTTVCYGSTECCALVELYPRRPDWDEVYYATMGNDGAGYKNLISAQVIHTDPNQGLAGVYSNISVSNWKTLPVSFHEIYKELDDACDHTCNLFDFKKEKYDIFFEVENATLRIDNFVYVVK
tara:strand:+ start:6433 stop:7347 length:915 start_codon:yes stop_codon:yes gene_type:complete